MTMRPIDESKQADDEYGPFSWGDADLMERFTAASAQVRALVPECTCMSVSIHDLGVTFTLVATDHRTATLDAVQYVDGGPCVDALDAGTVVDASNRLTVEEEWELFSEATRQNGVESTLSLPVRVEGESALGFNLYASTSTAFDGLHAQLAELLGAWVEDAVVDTDLAFRTRDLAKKAPAILEEATELAIVSTLLARSRRIGADEAEDRLRDAAARATIPLMSLLKIMREVLPD